MRHSASVHYNDVIMTTIASQITSLAVVYSVVYSDADHRKHQSSASLAFVWGIHRDRWIPRTKGQLRGKCFHLMTSSWSYQIIHHDDKRKIEQHHQFDCMSYYMLFNTMCSDSLKSRSQASENCNPVRCRYNAANLLKNLVKDTL